MIVSFHELLQLAGIFALFIFIVHLYQTWVLRQMRNDSDETHKAMAQYMAEAQRVVSQNITEAQNAISQNITGTQRAIAQGMEEGNRRTQEILREIGLHTKETHEKVIEIHEKVVP